MLRQHKTEIKTSQNIMTINGCNIKLETLPSGHMAINWTANMHEVNVQTVLMTTKVSRKDWTMPKVQAAMVKEIRNLQENGTYQEVPQEPWMVIVPSMWVIQRSTEDDGKQAGNLKARLVVRGDQDFAEGDIPCDSPTVDRSTVKLMLAIAANEDWRLRSIDISAAFLQGRQIDRIVHVQPPPEFKKPGTVWSLNKGLYGLKEAARLWYKELVERLQQNGGQKLTGDSACIVFHDDQKKLIGFVIIHVDDIIISGTQKFVDWIVAIIKRRFKVSKDQLDKFTYT
jgi:hypothetical protein